MQQHLRDYRRLMNSIAHRQQMADELTEAGDRNVRAMVKEWDRERREHLRQITQHHAAITTHQHQIDRHADAIAALDKRIRAVLSAWGVLRKEGD